MAIHEMVREAIHSKGLTQSGVAEKCGVSTGVMSRWLSGQKPIPATQLPLMLEILEIDSAEVAQRATDGELHRYVVSLVSDEDLGEIYRAIFESKEPLTKEKVERLCRSIHRK